MRVLLALVVAAVGFEAATMARWGVWLPAEIETHTPHLRRVEDPALRYGERVKTVNGHPVRRPEDWERAFLDTPIGGTVQVELDQRPGAIEVRVPQPHLTWPMGIALAIGLVLLPAVLFRAWNRPDAQGQLALLGIAAGMAITFASTFTSWPLHSAVPWLAWALVVAAQASTPVLSLIAFPTQSPWLRSLAWAVLVLMPLFAAAAGRVGYADVRLALLLGLFDDGLLDLIRTVLVLRLYLKLS